MTTPPTDIFAHFCPIPDSLFHIAGAADTAVDTEILTTTATVTDDYTSGLEPTPRPGDATPHSLVTALMIVLFTSIALAAKHLRHILRSMATDILGVRRRNNAFESHTSAETRTLATLILMGAICEAILLGTLVAPGITSRLSMFGAMLGLTVGYYLFQLAAYSVVGYAFTDTINATQWRRGFNLCQGLLGILLLLPALVILFYPAVSVLLLSVAAAVYIVVRITFIYKGFRIFYNSISSFVYFILYLCALEVIPPATVYSAARALNRLL